MGEEASAPTVAPPSRYYMKLETLNALQAVNNYDGAADKKGLLKVEADYVQKKGYVVELINAGRAANLDLKKAIASHKRDAGNLAGASLHVSAFRSSPSFPTLKCIARSASWGWQLPARKLDRGPSTQ
eukprot:3298452-Alexandrium_andersonii.AAC.1